MNGYPGVKRPDVRKWWIGITIWVVAVVCLSCGKESPPPEGPELPESFSFFEIGANTRLTDALRSTLRGKLGNDGISGRNVLNLELSYSGFLRGHFPGLEALNRDLNGPGGMRVEHDITTLTYRHMEKLPTPFDYVEVVFDAVTRKPLLIRIRTGRENVDLLDTLTRQYQEPRTIQRGEPSQVHSWEKNGDVLILSVRPNPVGRPIQEIGMYYVNGIRALLARERAEGGSGRPREDGIQDAFSRRGTAAHTPSAPESMRIARR